MSDLEVGWTNTYWSSYDYLKKKAAGQLNSTLGDFTINYDANNVLKVYNTNGNLFKIEISYGHLPHREWNVYTAMRVLK